MTFSLSTLFLMFGVLSATVTIITQVLKKATWDKIPTNLVVLIVSEVLSVGGVCAYLTHVGINLTWIYIFGSVIAGFCVAYISMFGYDKFIETLKRFHTLKEGEKNDK